MVSPRQCSEDNYHSTYDFIYYGSPFALLQNCRVYCGAYVGPSFFTDESLSEVWNKSETSFPVCNRLGT